MTSKWVCDFDEPLPPEWKDARQSLGGKGLSLKAMTEAGLEVPPGFTICTAACKAYYEAGRAWPDGLQQQVFERLRRLEQKTGRTFGRSARPLLVSVRSGAALSMPGMMDTLLNCGVGPEFAADMGDQPWAWTMYQQFIRAFARVVHGLDQGTLGEVTPDRSGTERLLSAFTAETGQAFPGSPDASLQACVSAVFDSWESPRAQAYRRRHDIRGLPGTAVTVQLMFPSEVSGVAFTIDPTNAGSGQMVIEASYGLGESVVSGEVTPDRFVVDRQSLAVAETVVGHKVAVVSAMGDQRHLDPDALSLKPDQVRELAALAMRVEQHFGTPVDIEWAFAEGRLALLQSRPIRGLDVARETERLRLEEIDRLGKASGSRRRVWIMHNLAETLRAPTPLTWSVTAGFMGGNGGFGRLYRILGYRPGKRVCDEGFLDLIAGRIYADPERLAELFWEAMPLSYDPAALAADKSLLERAPDRFTASAADARFLRRLPANLLSMLRAARTARRLTRTARDRFENQALPAWREYVRGERGRGLGSMSDQEVLEVLESRRKRTLDEFAPESLLPGFLGGSALSDLEATLTQLLGPQEGPALGRTLTMALDGDITYEQDRLLHELAATDGALEPFLERFGHRAVGEMELSVPRWREDPAYVHQTIGRLRQKGAADPVALHEASVRRRVEAEKMLPGILREAGGSSLRERIEGDLTAARTLLPYRETGKFWLMMGYELLRQAIEELARRWDLGSGVYFLELPELREYPARVAEFNELIEKRRLRWQAAQRLDVPDVIDSSDLGNFGKPPPLVAGSADLRATSLAPGVASGPVRIVSDPASAGELGSGYVLVCGSTDPAWTPLFMSAAALVVERGGVLSHGAIVARDFGIPAVACPNATRILAEGEAVKVDGTAGRIVRQAGAAGSTPAKGAVHG